MLVEFIPSLPRTLLPPARFRLFPTAAQRRRWEELPDALRASWIAEGERFLGWQWPQLTATGFMEFARTGNRSNFERLSFARRGALATLVIAECVEGEGRFLDDIVNGIWAICEESFWGVPAHNYGPEPLPDVEEPYVDLFRRGDGGPARLDPLPAQRAVRCRVAPHHATHPLRDEATHPRSVS